VATWESKPGWSHGGPSSPYALTGNGPGAGTAHRPRPVPRGRWVGPDRTRPRPRRFKTRPTSMPCRHPPDRESARLAALNEAAQHRRQSGNDMRALHLDDPGSVVSQQHPGDRAGHLPRRVDANRSSSGHAIAQSSHAVVVPLNRDVVATCQAARPPLLQV
jgi:hypothetical protein